MDFIFFTTNMIILDLFIFPSDDFLSAFNQVILIIITIIIILPVHFIVIVIYPYLYCLLDCNCCNTFAKIMNE